MNQYISFNDRLQKLSSSVHFMLVLGMELRNDWTKRTSCLILMKKMHGILLVSEGLGCNARQTMEMIVKNLTVLCTIFTIKGIVQRASTKPILELCSVDRIRSTELKDQRSMIRKWTTKEKNKERNKHKRLETCSAHRKTSNDKLAVNDTVENTESRQTKRTRFTERKAIKQMQSIISKRDSFFLTNVTHIRHFTSTMLDAPT